MSKWSKSALCLGAVVCLSGCQLFSSSSRVAGIDRSQVELADVFGQAELDDARSSLRNGNIAAAIREFRLAAINPSTRPDAQNGLAVAYAKLGRGDLAERYFLAALASAPESPRYLANLQRFYASDLGTVMVASRKIVKPVSEPQVVEKEAPAMARQTARRPEIFINSSSEPVDEANSPRLAGMPTRSRREIFVASVERRRARTSYPVRVALPEVGSRSAAAQGIEYPAKIALLEERAQSNKTVSFLDWFQ